MNTLALDGKTTLGRFEVEGEFIRTKFNRSEQVLADFALQMVDSAAATSSAETSTVETEIEAGFKGPFTSARRGFWVDFKYRLAPEWLPQQFAWSRFRRSPVDSCVPLGAHLVRRFCQRLRLFSRQGRCNRSRERRPRALHRRSRISANSLRRSDRRVGAQPSPLRHSTALSNSPRYRPLDGQVVRRPDPRRSVRILVTCGVL